MKRWEVIEQFNLGSEKSGHHGHKGVPGQRGGSAPSVGRGVVSPTSPQDPELAKVDELTAMFSNHAEMVEALARLRSDKSVQKSLINKARKGTPSQRDDYMKRADQMESFIKEREEKIAQLKDQQKQFKDTTAPGFGMWKRGEAERAIGGASVKYTVPDHPEYGTMTRYSFSGWAIQKVAASASIGYAGHSFEWSGTSSMANASAFVNKVFGIS